MKIGFCSECFMHFNSTKNLSTNREYLNCFWFFLGYSVLTWVQYWVQCDA